MVIEVLTYGMNIKSIYSLLEWCAHTHNHILTAKQTLEDFLVQKYGYQVLGYHFWSDIERFDAGNTIKVYKDRLFEMKDSPIDKTTVVVMLALMQAKAGLARDETLYANVSEVSDIFPKSYIDLCGLFSGLELNKSSEYLKNRFLTILSQMTILYFDI